MTKEYTIKTIIMQVLKEIEVDDTLIEEESEKIAFDFLQHNPHVSPDSLARAAAFLAKNKHTYVSTEDVRKISQNGGKENTSWMILIPVVRSVTKI